MLFFQVSPRKWREGTRGEGSGGKTDSDLSVATVARLIGHLRLSYATVLGVAYLNTGSGCLESGDTLTTRWSSS